MQPILLLIQRKTKVPTKHQNVHLFRSDWRKVGKIDYKDSVKLFRNIGKYGIMETDSQFAKWLKDNFGKGIYFISAFRKGRKGFWSFMKIELMDAGFRRLPKNVTKEELELRKEVADKKSLEKRKSYSSGEERDYIEAEIQTSEEIIDSSKKELKDTKGKKRGCYPYLQSVQPVYGFHSYEDYGNFEDEEAFIGRMV